MSDQERREKIQRLLDDMGMTVLFGKRDSAERINMLHMDMCNIPGIEIGSDRADLRLAAELTVHSQEELTLSAIQHVHTAHSEFRHAATTGVMLLELGTALRVLGELLMTAGASKMSDEIVMSARGRLEQGDETALRDLLSAISGMMMPGKETKQ